MTLFLKFQPLNDQVLIKMDVKKKSVIVDPNGKAMIVPSGIVQACGRGIFVQGQFIETQVKPGDHVAVSMEGSWTRIPLDDDPNEIYMTVSESLIIGKIDLLPDQQKELEARLHESDDPKKQDAIIREYWSNTPWFKTADEAAGNAFSRR
jgi:co-chaperonin GroES (HSP10)